MSTLLIASHLFLLGRGVDFNAEAFLQSSSEFLKQGLGDLNASLHEFGHSSRTQLFAQSSDALSKSLDGLGQERLRFLALDFFLVIGCSLSTMFVELLLEVVKVEVLGEVVAQVVHVRAISNLLTFLEELLKNFSKFSDTSSNDAADQ